jgi:hypothetical protein
MPSDLRTDCPEGQDWNDHLRTSGWEELLEVGDSDSDNNIWIKAWQRKDRGPGFLIDVNDADGSTPHVVDTLPELTAFVASWVPVVRAPIRWLGQPPWLEEKHDRQLRRGGEVWQTIEGPAHPSGWLVEETAKRVDPGAFSSDDPDHEWERDNTRREVRAVLAALFDICEVRERWGTRYSGAGAEDVYAWWRSREEAESQSKGSPRVPRGDLVCRCELLTPPAPPEPAAHTLHDPRPATEER